MSLADLDIAWHAPRSDGRVYISSRVHQGQRHAVIVRETHGKPDVVIWIKAGDELRNALCGLADIARRVNGAEKLEDEERVETRAFLRGIGRRTG